MILTLFKVGVEFKARMFNFMPEAKDNPGNSLMPVNAENGPMYNKPEVGIGKNACLQKFYCKKSHPSENLMKSCETLLMMLP